jgi:hypothetical protein
MLKSRNGLVVSLLAYANLFILIICYFVGGVLLAKRLWALSVLVLFCGYGTITLFYVIGMNLTMADKHSRALVLVKARLAAGLTFSILGLVLLGAGTFLLQLDPSVEMGLVLCGFFSVIVGYYLAVSSHRIIHPDMSSN